MQHSPALASASRLREKLPHGEGDLLDVRFQREVSRIQQLDSCGWDIPPLGLRACGDEKGSVLAPDREQRRLRLPEILLEGPIQLHVLCIV